MENVAIHFMRNILNNSLQAKFATKIRKKAEQIFAKIIIAKKTGSNELE